MPIASSRRSSSSSSSSSRSRSSSSSSSSSSTPGPFIVEVRMEKPVGLHGSRLRPIPGEK